MHFHGHLLLEINLVLLGPVRLAFCLLDDGAEVVLELVDKVFGHGIPGRGQLQDLDGVESVQGLIRDDGAQLARGRSDRQGMESDVGGWDGRGVVCLAIDGPMACVGGVDLVA